MAMNFNFVNEAELITTVTNAMSRVAERVQNDLLVAARKNIQKYYDQYDPDVYERTYDLANSVVHFGFINNLSSGTTISFESGFNYDSMGPHSYRGGSAKYGGSADPEWIFGNFLEGIHPRTGKDYKYIPIQSKSQNDLMDEYANRYLGKKIYGYIQSELDSAFSSL